MTMSSPSRRRGPLFLTMTLASGIRSFLRDDAALYDPVVVLSPGLALIGPAFALLLGPWAGETPEALFTQAERLAGEGRLDEAASAYERAIRLAPRQAVLHDRLAFLRGRQGRTEEAIAGFRKAIALQPTLFDPHYHLGATLWW